MSYVPTTNLTALYTNTTGGTVADPAAVDNAIIDIVATINSNSDSQATLVTSGVLTQLGAINVKSSTYNASGSAQTTTGSITAGTAILTLAVAKDFVNGQGINVYGKYEVASLAISASCTSSANCTITLNGIDKTVALTNGNTATQVATAIRAVTFPGWTTGGSGTTVTFTATTTGIATDAVYTVGTTGATGTMTTTTQGTEDLISTILSGGGTLTLTLSSNADTTVSNVTVQHDDTAAILAVITAVKTNGGNMNIIFPAGTYYYRPNYVIANAWRLAIEMVDVQNVTIFGYGATIQQVKSINWQAGQTVTPSWGNQESPIQFRSTTLYGCKNISIYGLRLVGANVPYIVATGDGGCFGFAFRGVSNVYLHDVYAYGWGTDGLYLGASYSDTYKGRYAKVINSEFDANTRQGCSVAGVDYCNFTNTIFSNTTGGSFGHGLDFEPGASLTQKGMTLNGCTFIDNQRGALNFIRTSDVEVSNCNLYETLADGAIYSDGDSDSISIDNCRINTLKAALYVVGSNVTNLSLTNSKIKTTGLPNNLATIRINPAGSATNVKYLKIRNNRFEGTGGFLANMDGDFHFEDNTMLISKQNSSDADCFSLTGNGTGKNYIRKNKIVINTDVVCTLKDCNIVDGVFEHNDISSHVAAPYSIQDYNGGRVLTIGHNIFSTYFYYKGAVSQLDLKVEGTIVEMISGEFGLSTRKVHGGRYRVSGGVGSLVGDITKNTTNLQASIAELEYICTVAGSPGTWISTQWRTIKGTTAARPTPASYSIGLTYMDTTLDADGKIIWWNGTAWVDATGATV